MATESRREMCGAFLRVESEVGEAAEKRGRLRDWGSHGKKRKGAQGSPCHGKTEEGEKMKAKAVEKEWGGRRRGGRTSQNHQVRGLGLSNGEMEIAICSMFGEHLVR